MPPLFLFDAILTMIKILFRAINQPIRHMSSFNC